MGLIRRILDLLNGKHVADLRFLQARDMLSIFLSCISWALDMAGYFYYQDSLKIYYATLALSAFLLFDFVMRTFLPTYSVTDFVVKNVLRPLWPGEPMLFPTDALYFRYGFLLFMVAIKFGLRLANKSQIPILAFSGLWIFMLSVSIFHMRPLYIPYGLMLKFKVVEPHKDLPAQVYTFTFLGPSVEIKRPDCTLPGGACSTIRAPERSLPEGDSTTAGGPLSIDSIEITEPKGDSTLASDPESIEVVEL